MKTGFNLLLWTTHLTDNLLPVCQQLKDAGYDGVEVPIFEADPDYYASLGRKLDDIGLKRTVVGLVTSEDANPCCEDTAVHEAGIEHLKWLVDCSNALGAEVLCGPFTQPLAIFSGTGPTEGEWEALVTAHKTMAAHAKGSKLTLAVEPLNRFECYALTTNADAARLVTEVGAENYGYLYDTFHSNIEERDPVGSIAATAPAIAHVHISENDRGTPGRGHVDFQATFNALAEAGYDGWLTIEAFGQALPDLAAATKVWRPLYNSQEEVYTEGLALLQRGWATAKGN